MTRRALAALALLLPGTAFADGGMPSYLFIDWRYWLFLIAYVLITMRIVTWVRRLADLRDEKKPFPLQDISWGAAFLLFNGLIYQALHHYEHVTQIFQYWYLGDHKSVSQGVVFFLDVEWNHFLFDSLYFVMLVFACRMFYKKWTARGHEVDEVTQALMVGTLGVQGWHAMEHTYRIFQHVRIGCEPCAGIADQVFNIPLIPLHFWFNVLALTFPMMLFFWLRMDYLTAQFISEFNIRLRAFMRPPQLAAPSQG